MPTYEYRCKTCEVQFELTQSFKDKTLTRCPKSNGPAACVSPGKGEVAKVFAAPGITFKGSGFYKTDAGSAAKASAGKDKETSSSESAASSGSDKESSGDSSTKSETKKDTKKDKVSTTAGSSSNSSDK